jgi:very-short-patch-repair endonuclease
MAAVLASGPRSVLSHRSAGRLWGLIPADPGTVDVTRPGGPRTRRIGIVGHESRLAEDETAVIRGIPTTSPFRTVLDLSALLTTQQLERAINEVEVQGLVDRISLPQLVARHSGHRGVAALRALLDAAEPGGITRSRLEEEFVALVDRHELPRPRLNAALHLRGRFLEVDCLWQLQRLAVELDGRAVHGTRRSFEADRERDRILVTEGWRPVRVTWRQVRDEPEVVIQDLRRLLAG